jgi:HEAT repeat protein
VVSNKAKLTLLAYLSFGLLVVVSTSSAASVGCARPDPRLSQPPSSASANDLWNRARLGNDSQMYRVFKYYFPADERSAEADRIIRDELERDRQRLMPTELARARPLTIVSGREGSLDELRRQSVSGSALIRLMRDRLAVRATATLQQLLANSDPTVRQVAADAIGRIGADWMISDLIVACSDTIPAVRQQAALALGRLHAVDSADTLGKLVSEDTSSSVRESAAVALATIGGWRSSQMLVGQALHDPKRDVVRAAAQGLRGDYETDSLDSLQGFAGAEQAELRRAVAVALGYLGSPRATPVLTCLLDDRDEGVRSEAAWALGAIEDFSAGEALAARLSDKSWSVRRTTVLALAALREERWYTNAHNLTQDTNIAVRQAAIESLGYFHQASVLGEIGQFSGDVSPAARIGVARAYGVSLDRAAIPLLLKMVREDPSSAVRLAAAEALTKYSTIDKAAIPDFDSGATDTAFRGAVVLLAARNPDATGALAVVTRAAHDDRNSEIRSLAVEALGRFQSASVHDSLIAALRDHDHAVSAAAARALAHAAPCTDVGLPAQATDFPALLPDRAAFQDAIAEISHRCGLAGLRTFTANNASSWYPYLVSEIFHAQGSMPQCPANSAAIPQGTTAIAEVFEGTLGHNDGQWCRAVEGIFSDPDPFVRASASAGFLDVRLRGVMAGER